MDRFEAWLRESGWADYVIGWHLAAGSTEEFIRPVLHPLQYCDYSQAACAHYRRWLGERYGSVEALNRPGAVPDRLRGHNSAVAGGAPLQWEGRFP